MVQLGKGKRAPIKKQPPHMGRYANLGQVKAKPGKLPRQHKHFLWFWRLSRPKKIMVCLLPILLFLIIVPIASYFYYARDIGDQERLMNRNNTGIVLTDAKDKVIYSVGNAERRNLVQLKDISESMKKALIASEDKDFYKHSGFNIFSIFRAAITRHGGGSTLTQQLVKNNLLSNEHSFMRKYQELFMAIAIEQNYSKEQILMMYLNSVYFGENAFGIEEAAKVYFNKSPKDLTLAESSMLVGVLPAPSRYSPISGNAEYAKQRQRTVLGRMQTEGFITEEQKQQAEATQLAYAGGGAAHTNSAAPHFAEMVIKQLSDKYGYEKVMRSGYRVKTSLNLDTQQLLQENIAKQMKQINRLGGTNASGIVIDPKTGEVRALVGSADYNNAEWGKVNMVTTPRQPGSSFKPLYYAQAMADGAITPATVFDDKLTDFNGYVPYNATRRWNGKVTTRKSLSWSLNIPSVLIMQKYGINRSIQAVKKLGISTLDENKNYGLSLALGSAEVRLSEMTNAYAAFANGGTQYESLNLITEVKDKFNKNASWKTASTRQAISQGGAYLISSILSDNAARAGMFGSSLTVGGKTVAVKTGTTNDNRDAWTIGYTPQYAVGVWVGNNNNKVMNSGGSDVAAPIWRATMTKLLAGAKTGFDVPSGVVQRSVCSSNGGLADDSSPGAYKEYFLSSAIPTEKCDQTKPKIEVCNLATKQVESIFEDQFDAAKYSKNAADCRQTPTTKQITVCDLATKRLITISEDKFDATKHSRKTASCGSTGNDDQNPGGGNGSGSGSGSGGGSGGTSPGPTNPPGGGDRRP
jgi:penicillin-binding protein, 1A family